VLAEPRGYLHASVCVDENPHDEVIATVLRPERENLFG
jgi:hypothetical protein